MQRTHFLTLIVFFCNFVLSINGRNHKAELASIKSEATKRKRDEKSFDVDHEGLKQLFDAETA